MKNAVLRDSEVSRQYSLRRGSLLSEIIISSIVTGVIALSVGPAISGILRQQDRRRFETLALIELGNQRWAASGEVELSQWFSERYPDAILMREVAAEVDELLPFGGAFRLTIERPDREGLPSQSVEMVVWPEAGRSGT
jgi:hypothetical protein